MIGIVILIIQVLLHQILWDLALEKLECCGAARGTATVTASVLPTAAGSTQRIPAAALVFVVRAHHSSVLLFSGALKI